MWLINVTTYALEHFLESKAPRYAILSHTWGDAEVSYQDMRQLEEAKMKRGFTKIRYTCEQALKDDISHAWVDTCCIDKSSSAELQEAINSMYRWYNNAERCYVYLSDVSGGRPDLGSLESIDLDDLESIDIPVANAFWVCVWFTRGWTLQELCASRDIQFFDRSWASLGSKRGLSKLISLRTGISESFLRNPSTIMSASVAERMFWASCRKTTRPEDRSYSLLGIFGVSMPMLYGEGGESAFARLQEEIIRTSEDPSILAWDSRSREWFNPLAPSPSEFARAGSIRLCGRCGTFERTKRGVRISVPVIDRKNTHDGKYQLAVLSCHNEGDSDSLLAIPIEWSGDSYTYRIIDPPKGLRLEKVRFEEVLGHQPNIIEIQHNYSSTEPQFWLQPSEDVVYLDFYVVNGRWEHGQLSFGIFSDTSRSRVAAVTFTGPAGEDFLLAFGTTREGLPKMSCKRLATARSDFAWSRQSYPLEPNQECTEESFGAACVRSLYATIDFHEEHVNGLNIRRWDWLCYQCSHSTFPCSECHNEFLQGHRNISSRFDNLTTSTAQDSTGDSSVTVSMIPHPFLGSSVQVVEITSNSEIATAAVNGED